MKKIINAHKVSIGCHRLRSLAFRLCIIFLCSIIAVPVTSANDFYKGNKSPALPVSGTDASQQDIVKGTVKDATTGEALVGVTVVIKGTTMGTLTDIKGQFSLRLPQKQSTISISFIGYATQELVVTQGTNVSISMQLEITEMQEVVVVGYGTQKKESVVGAIAQVNNATIMKSGLSNITQALSGKLSGVLTMQTTGQPGLDQSEIIIRGLSSWNSSTPLVLVDGVERDFKDLDPNEVGSISVLKDASATAVFGARGANGVIIVTTKRGTLGKPQLDFSGYTGVEIPTRVPDHIDSYTTLSMLNVAYRNQSQFSNLISDAVLAEYRSPSSPLMRIRYPDVNWFEELTKPFAMSNNANLNVQGGTKFTKYFASLGYTHQGSIIEGTKKGYLNNNYFYNRLNYRANFDFSLTNTSQLSLNLGGDLSVTNQPTTPSGGGTQGGMWKSMYGTSPARFPAYFPAWVLQEIPDPDYPHASGERFSAAFLENKLNPYNQAKQGAFERRTSSKLFTDLILDQKLDFILKGLSAKGKVSLSTYYVNISLNTSYAFPEYQIDWTKVGVSGQNPWYRANQGLEVFEEPPISLSVGGLGTGYYTDLYYEMSISYANEFGKHRVSGLALLNRQQKNLETQFPYYNEGLVGRATYDYSNKYFIEINVGYTGSERFAPGNRFGFFPSGALGWMISEEDFFKNSIPWMNKLKLRYSDGLVGSDYAKNRWLYISDYGTDSRGNIWEGSVPNIYAQWEEAHKRDIGLEMGFLKNLFTLNIDFFDEKRSKMLLEPNSATFVIGNLFKELNLGKMKKHGIEVEAEFNKTTARNLNYYIKANFGFNENRIMYKDDPPYAPDYAKAAGKSLGTQNGALLANSGYLTSVDDIHNYLSAVARPNNVPGDYAFVDFNVDGIISSVDLVPQKGNLYPPITYSFGTGLSYKGFDFNMMFAGNMGKYVDYGTEWMGEFNYLSWRVNKAQLNYWRPDNQVNPSTHTLHFTQDPHPTISWAGLGSPYIEGQWWRNADYLRLRDVYLGYTLNPNFLKRKLGITNMKVYVTANNLLTITKLIQGDPERSNFGTGYYPIMTSVKLGVRFVF